MHAIAVRNVILSEDICVCVRTESPFNGIVCNSEVMCESERYISTVIFSVRQRRCQKFAWVLLNKIHSDCSFADFMNRMIVSYVDSKISQICIKEGIYKMQFLKFLQKLILWIIMIARASFSLRVYDNKRNGVIEKPLIFMRC